MSPSEFRASQEKHGKPQGCHERLLHHTTARACIGLRSPTGGGEHDNGSTPQPVSGTVGASVLENTMTVHLVALPPPPDPLDWALRHPNGANMRARRQGYVSGGHALRGTQDCRASWGLCVAWDSLRLRGCHGGHALHGTRSHIILEQREVGGWRWLSGVRRCVGCKAHTDNLALAPSPPICATACEPEQPGPHKHASTHCCKE